MNRHFEGYVHDHIWLHTVLLGPLGENKGFGASNSLPWVGDRYRTGRRIKAKWKSQNWFTLSI